jgi:hypothetical protein
MLSFGIFFLFISFSGGKPQKRKRLDAREGYAMLN